MHRASSRTAAVVDVDVHHHPLGLLRRLFMTPPEQIPDLRGLAFQKSSHRRHLVLDPALAHRLDDAGDRRAEMSSAADRLDTEFGKHARTLLPASCGSIPLPRSV